MTIRVSSTASVASEIPNLSRGDGSAMKQLPALLANILVNDRLPVDQLQDSWMTWGVTNIFPQIESRGWDFRFVDYSLFR